MASALIGRGERRLCSARQRKSPPTRVSGSGGSRYTPRSASAARHAPLPSHPRLHLWPPPTRHAFRLFAPPNQPPSPSFNRARRIYLSIDRSHHSFLTITTITLDSALFTLITTLSPFRSNITIYPLFPDRHDSTTTMINAYIPPFTLNRQSVRTLPSPSTIRHIPLLRTPHAGVQRSTPHTPRHTSHVVVVVS